MSIVVTRTPAPTNSTTVDPDQGLVLDGRNFGVQNDYWLLAGGVLLVILIFLWCCCRSRKYKRLAKKSNEAISREVYDKLRQLDNDVMTGMANTVKVTLPRPSNVRPKKGGPSRLNRNTGRPATEPDPENPDAPPAPPPRPGGADSGQPDVQRDFADELSLLFGREIQTEAQSSSNSDDPLSVPSALAVRKQLIKFVEEDLLVFVKDVTEHTYRYVDRVLKGSGKNVFDAAKSEPSDELRRRARDEASFIPWAMCCCVCPGPTIKQVYKYRKSFYSALRDRVMALGGIKTNEADGKLPESDRARIAAERRRAEQYSSFHAPQVIAPCVRRGWVLGAKIEGGEEAQVVPPPADGDIELQTPNRPTQPSPPTHCVAIPHEGESRNTLKECNTLEELFSQHYSIYLPQCLDARPREAAIPNQMISQSPYIMRVDDPGEDDIASPNGYSPAENRDQAKQIFSDAEALMLRTFALNNNQDMEILGCCDHLGSSLRNDLHLYMQLLRYSVLFYAHLPKKTHYPMYDLVPLFDSEIKAWLKDTVEFLARREADSWKKNYMSMAKQVIDFEVQAAAGRIKDRKTKGEFDGIEADPKLAAVNNSTKEDLVEQMRQVIQGQYSNAFLTDRIDEAPETKAACCGFCLPDLPAIRREVPATHEKIESSIKSILRDIVIGDSRTEEHLKEARAELVHLREKLLDMLYPPDASWSSPTTLGAAGSGGAGFNSQVDLLASPTGRSEVEDTAQSFLAEGGGADEESLPLISYQEIIDSIFLKMIEGMEKTVTNAIIKREERIALEVIQHNPTINKDVQKLAQTIFSEQAEWMNHYSKMMITLKKIHRQSKDLCAVGRESEVILAAGGGAPPSLVELLFSLREDFATLEAEASEDIISLIPFNDAVCAYNHWADRCNAAPYLTTRGQGGGVSSTGGGESHHEVDHPYGGPPTHHANGEVRNNNVVTGLDDAPPVGSQWGNGHIDSASGETEGVGEGEMYSPMGDGGDTTGVAEEITIELDDSGAGGGEIGPR